tara:strand:+ start:7965 stop:8474 length:510 start_codon:yes stop_codon:yes gene_type:complete
MYNKRADGSIIEKLASDGVQHLDGRYSVENMTLEIRSRIARSSFLKGVVAFKILKGDSYRTSNPITELIDADYNVEFKEGDTVQFIGTSVDLRNMWIADNESIRGILAHPNGVVGTAPQQGSTTVLVNFEENGLWFVESADLKLTVAGTVDGLANLCTTRKLAGKDAWL